MRTARRAPRGCEGRVGALPRGHLDYVAAPLRRDEVVVVVQSAIRGVVHVPTAPQAVRAREGGAVTATIVAVCAFARGGRRRRRRAWARWRRNGRRGRRRCTRRRRVDQRAATACAAPGWTNAMKSATRAPGAVDGRPVAGPHSGSAEPPRAARRALRRHRGRAGALSRGDTLTVLQHIISAVKSPSSYWPQYANSYSEHRVSSASYAPLSLFTHGAGGGDAGGEGGGGKGEGEGGETGGNCGDGGGAR